MNVEEVRKQVGHRIKVRRVELDLQQKELAEKIGASQSQISEWELGSRAMRIEHAMILAEALQTTVAYLAGEAPRV